MSTPLYRRILVGIDGSDPSGRAVAHATQLAHAYGAALRIVHVVDLSWLLAAPQMALDVDQAVKAWRAQGADLLAAAAKSAREAGVEAETRLVETTGMKQHPAEALVGEAGAWPADLLVIGARGRRGVERFLVGSVADGVVRRATVPLLLVH